MDDNTKYWFKGVIYQLCIKNNITNPSTIDLIRMSYFVICVLNPLFMILYAVAESHKD